MSPLFPRALGDVVAVDYGINLLTRGEKENTKRTLRKSKFLLFIFIK